jgi:hypothetical protein
MDVPSLQEFMTYIYLLRYIYATSNFNGRRHLLTFLAVGSLINLLLLQLPLPVLAPAALHEFDPHELDPRVSLIDQPLFE